MNNIFEFAISKTDQDQLMTNPAARNFERARMWAAEPTVAELARRYPDRTYVHTIPAATLHREEMEVARALLAGGHRKADRIEPFTVAVEILIDDLHDIAVYQSIDNYRTDYAINEYGNLEITFVFASLAQAVLFRLATSLL